MRPNPDLIEQVLRRDRKIQRLFSCLDQISSLTKNGRASRIARSCALFEKTLPDHYQFDEENAPT